MKKIIMITAVMLLPLALLPAEQLSKIGIVNFSRIVEDYFSESAAWREIDAMREKYEEGKEAILEEINQLKMDRLEAENDGEELKALRLSDRLRQKEEYLKEYHNIWSSRINSKISNVYQSSSFTSEILTAIEFIAETEGLSMVIRSQDPNVLWYNKEVDITDMVLKRLRDMAAR